MKKLLLTFHFIFLYSLLFAQNPFQNTLELDSILEVKYDKNYQRPIGTFCISPYGENKALAMAIKPEKDRNEYTFSGIQMDLKNKKTRQFSFQLSSKKLDRYSMIKSVSVKGDLILINLSDVQLLVKKENDKYSLVRQYTFPNMQDNSYINEEEIYLSKANQPHPMDKQGPNRIIHYDRNTKDSASYEINIPGVGFSHLQPAHYTAFTNGHYVVAHPVHYKLFYYEKGKKTFETKNPHKDWHQTSEKDLTVLSRIQDGNEIINFLRKLNNKMSRIWSLDFLDEETLLVKYHYPDSLEDGMDFYMDVWKKKWKKWKPVMKKLELSNWTLPDSTILTKENYPARFTYVGNLYFFTKDYLGILTEEGSEDYRDKTHGQYFSSDLPFKNMRLTIFKHDL